MRCIVLAFTLACLIGVGVRAEEISMEQRGGTWCVPVGLNGVLTLDFTVDSGASEMHIPMEVAMILIRSGTLTDSDFLPGATYVLADGSEVRSPRFMLRKVTVGGVELKEVEASIGKAGSSLLLGQSFLGRVGTWSMDTQKRVLVLGAKARRIEPITSAEARTRLLRHVGKLVAIMQEEGRGRYLTSRNYIYKDGLKVDPSLYVAREHIEAEEKWLQDCAAAAESLPYGRTFGLMHEGLRNYKDSVTAGIQALEKGDASGLTQAQAKQYLVFEKYGQALAELYAAVSEDDQRAIRAEIQKSLLPVSYFPGQPMLGVSVGPDKDGLLVQAAADGLPAFQAGVREGDVILSVNGRKISTVESFSREVGVVDQVNILEVRKPSGQTATYEVKCTRYAPYGFTSYVKFGVARLVNNSISQDSTGRIQSRLFEHLMKQRNRLAYVEIFPNVDLPRPYKKVDLKELYNKQYVKYLTYCEIRQYEERSEPRAFVGPVRVCVVELGMELYDCETGQRIWDNSREEMVDKFGKSNFEGLELCATKAVEYLIDDMKNFLEKYDERTGRGALSFREGPFKALEFSSGRLVPTSPGQLTPNRPPKRELHFHEPRQN